jgi:hypothetical protein
MPDDTAATSSASSPSQVPEGAPLVDAAKRPQEEVVIMVPPNRPGLPPLVIRPSSDSARDHDAGTSGARGADGDSAETRPRFRLDGMGDVGGSSGVGLGSPAGSTGGGGPRGSNASRPSNASAALQAIVWATSIQASRDLLQVCCGLEHGCCGGAVVVVGKFQDFHQPRCLP